MTASTKTLLNVILVSHPDRFASSGTLRLGISDHDLVYIVRKQKLPKPKARILEYRSMKNFFLSDLRNTPWDSAYVFDNIDDIWPHWGSLLEQVLDNQVPIKRRCLRFNQLPWINPGHSKRNAPEEPIIQEIPAHSN